MKTNSELLQQYVEAGGNCVNLGRHLKVAHAELYTWILESTRFLDVKPKVKDTERIFCIQNNITALLLNKDGTFARFINLFSGYCIKKPQTPKPAKITRTKVVKTKIEKFVERSRHRNPHLYVEAAIEGIDYIVCPVSGARMAMIKRNYITNVLGMTVDEYDLLYPGVRRVSLSRQQNIKAGLKQIDPDIGLSKYEAGQVKARAKLKEADSAGKSGYKRKGEKTRATHMKNIDAMGRNGYRQQADARLTTILDNGLTVEENAHRKQRETLMQTHATGTGGASTASMIALRPILNWLDTNKINYYFDRQEYCILDEKSGNYYFFDLTIPDFKLAIEYQSVAWHANPAWDSDRLHKWTTPRGKKVTAIESIMYDRNKAQALLETRHMNVRYVWEDSKNSDVEEILCLLKTLNTKY